MAEIDVYRIHQIVDNGNAVQISLIEDVQTEPLSQKQLIIENVSKKFEEQKPVLKLELKEELRKELATKEDLELMGEKILRYVDNKINQVNEKINQLDKKIDEEFYQLDKKVDTLKRDIIIVALIIILANYAPSIIGKILSFLK